MRVRRLGASTLPMLLALAVSALSGCGEDDGSPRAGEDPGQVLQSVDTSAGPVHTWALAEEPRFSLTGSESDPEFYFVGWLDGVILDDGSTIIQDGQAATLVYLDPEGSPTRVAGGPGEGPGEFQRPSELLIAPGGAGVWAWDSPQRRLSHFDRSGEFVTSFAPPVRSNAAPAGVLPGPTFVTIAEPVEGTGAEPARRRYALRDSLWAVVREIEGPPEPVSDVLVWNDSGITTANTEGPSSHSSLHEGCVPQLEEVVIGDELFAADAASGVIHAFGEDDSVREVYRASRRRSVTPEIRTAVEARFEGSIERSRLLDPSAGARRAILREVSDRLGDRLPAWQGVMADPEGRIWLERSKCPIGGGNPDVFDVVGVDGQWLGSIAIPAETGLPLAVRGDDVLVTRLDELGVAHVEIYRLVTAEGAAER